MNYYSILSILYTIPCYHAIIFLFCLVFNILKKLIPHIMEVGGSVYLLQNGMDDSPTCGNIKSRRIFHPTQNQLTLWPFESWILPQNTQKYDEIWQGPFNFFKHIWLILCHIFSHLIWLQFTLTFKLNISSQSYQHAHMLAVTEFQNIKNPSKSTHLQCFQLE